MNYQKAFLLNYYILCDNNLNLYNSTMSEKKYADFVAVPTILGKKFIIIDSVFDVSLEVRIGETL